MKMVTINAIREANYSLVDAGKHLRQALYHEGVHGEVVDALASTRSAMKSLEAIFRRLDEEDEE